MCSLGSHLLRQINTFMEFCVFLFTKYSRQSMDQTYHPVAILTSKTPCRQWVHTFLALGTGAIIPYPDAVATAVQTQASYLTPIRWSHIGDDATNHKILDRLTVWTRHSRNLLSEEPTPFIHLSFISASPTAIFQFPSHLTLNSNLFQSFQMAEQQFPVAVAQMHTVTLTVAEIAA